MFWGDDDTWDSIYKKTLTLIEAAEEQGEAAAALENLVLNLGLTTEKQQDPLLCALSDSEIPLSEVLLDIISELLISENLKLAVTASSCLINCGGRIGKMKIAEFLERKTLPHADNIRWLLEQNSSRNDLREVLTSKPLGLEESPGNQKVLSEVKIVSMRILQFMFERSQKDDKYPDLAVLSGIIGFLEGVSEEWLRQKFELPDQPAQDLISNSGSKASAMAIFRRVLAEQREIGRKVGFFSGRPEKEAPGVH